MNLSTIVEKFVRLQNNALAILNKFLDFYTSKEDFVKINLDTDNGNEQINLPTLSNLRKSLDGLNKDLEVLKNLVNFNQIDTKPKTINQIIIPQEFNTEPNWFFETMQSPLPFIEFDFSNFIDLGSNQIVCLRYIFDKEDSFAQEYIGNNNIIYKEFIEKLKNNNSNYIIDKDIFNVNNATIQKYGKFIITNIFNENNLTYFKLDTLEYSFSETKNLLNLGDTIIFGDSKFLIEAINQDENLIGVKKIIGNDFPLLGSECLIYETNKKNKIVKVPILPDKIIFQWFKTISDSGVEDIDWSVGICYLTNNFINKEGKFFNNFWKENIKDFGILVQGLLKENLKPAFSLLKPKAPVLFEENFKVVQVNTHKTNNERIKEIIAKQNDKIKLESEISEISKSLEEKTKELNSTNFNSEIEKQTLLNIIENLIQQKKIKTSQYITIINEINLLSTQIDQFANEPKYHIRGFFEIPLPNEGPNGLEEIIGFRIFWRYVNPNNEASKTEEYKYRDSFGNIKVGSFSNWLWKDSIIKTKIYSKELDKFIWKQENIENSQEININQIDISITSNEAVEFFVCSISEAGYPINLNLSEPSNIIKIVFPNELNTSNQLELAIEQNKSENLLLKVKEDLNSQGLPQHLKDSFNTTSKYYAHTAENLASGFFTPEGNVINIFEKLKELENRLFDLENRLNKVITPCKIFIIDDETNQKIEIKNGDTITLFAGYYKDKIETLSPSQRRGAIINKIWKLQILNDQASPLYFISRFPGGFGEALEDSQSLTNNDLDYKRRMYDYVPIVNLGITSKDSNNSNRVCQAFYQSGQIKGQFIYCRYTDVGLVNKLYDSTTTISNRKLLPKLTASTPNPQSWVWDGANIPISSLPSGGGDLTDFCIHIQHPYLQNINIVRNLADVQTPNIQLNNDLNPISEESVPLFCHSAYFNLTSGQNNYSIQLNYRDNWKLWSGSRNPGTYTPNIQELPDKFGFLDSDRFLIGKNTCGAYLFLGPKIIESILVEGTDARAKRELAPGENNSIIIPIVFQYRMTDYYGPPILDDNTAGSPGIVGGYDESNPIPPKNITYTKKLGIDIFQLDLNVFSFDIQVSATYQRDSNLQILDITIPPRIKNIKNIKVKKDFTNIF